MLFKIKKALWQEDNTRSFRVDETIVSEYFNKTQSLVFSPESANIEERALKKLININDGSKVLDLGCGNGRWGSILIPKCKKYVGVDLSKHFIEKAIRKYDSNRTRFYCLPAQDYLVKEKFDLILMIGLTTYMNDEDIEKMANNCSKMLAKEGKLIVRSVTLRENGIKRRVFCRKSGFIRKLFGRPDYQIIRRSCYEEVRLFSMFTLEHQENIENTGYTVYILHLKT